MGYSARNLNLIRKVILLCKMDGVADRRNSQQKTAASLFNYIQIDNPDKNLYHF